MVDLGRRNKILENQRRNRHYQFNELNSQWLVFIQATNKNRNNKRIKNAGKKKNKIFEKKKKKKNEKKRREKKKKKSGKINDKTDIINSRNPKVNELIMSFSSLIFQ